SRTKSFRVTSQNRRRVAERIWIRFVEVFEEILWVRKTDSDARQIDEPAEIRRRVNGVEEGPEMYGAKRLVGAGPDDIHHRRCGGGNAHLEPGHLLASAVVIGGGETNAVQDGHLRHPLRERSEMRTETHAAGDRDLVRCVRDINVLFDLFNHLGIRGVNRV